LLVSNGEASATSTNILGLYGLTIPPSLLAWADQVIE
jgi:hypothetical protein